MTDPTPGVATRARTAVRAAGLTGAAMYAVGGGRVRVVLDGGGDPVALLPRLYQEGLVVVDAEPARPPLLPALPGDPTRPARPASLVVTMGAPAGDPVIPVVPDPSGDDIAEAMHRINGVLVRRRAAGEIRGDDDTDLEEAAGRLACHRAATAPPACPVPDDVADTLYAAIGDEIAGLGVDIGDERMILLVRDADDGTLIVTVPVPGEDAVATYRLALTADTAVDMRAVVRTAVERAGLGDDVTGFARAGGSGVAVILPSGVATPDTHARLAGALAGTGLAIADPEFTPGATRWVVAAGAEDTPGGAP